MDILGGGELNDSSPSLLATKPTRQRGLKGRLRLVIHLSVVVALVDVGPFPKAKLSNTFVGVLTGDVE